ncbi:MAG TPA: hypothetical protein VLE97_08480 [Gaiellaceae bacterium]|nr:hypothetical protein [Gaiellaceae bacterium]
MYSLPPVPAYKAHVATICRANTPSLKLYTRRIVTAQANDDAEGTLLNYRLALQLGLKQNAAIYVVPVPIAAKTRMTPILKNLHAQDPVLRAAVTAARTGQALTLQALVKRINVLGVAANRLFDAYGVPDCGSRQS